MKRLWIGAVTLAVLLGACLWTSYAMDAVHGPISDQLDKAADAALAEDWAQATALAAEARAEWDRSWRMTASVADHTPMDEVDGLFAQLPAYARDEEAVHFAATCAQLSRLVAAMGEAHSFNWWNLL